MSCPSQDCGGTRPEQQALTAHEKSLVGGLDWAGQAQRCSGCGCVYTREAQGYPTIRGWLDNGMAGPGWKPSRTV